MPQQRYWRELYDLRSHANYVDEYLNGTERIDRILNMTVAIASSSSIGAWAVWHEHALLWSTIIVVSNVINAIRPFLPYKTRLKALGGLLHDMEELCIQAEMKWLEVAGGQLSAEEINKLQFDFRLKKQRLFKKYLPNSTLPLKQPYLQAAEDSAIQHFENYYAEVKYGQE